MPRHLLRIRGMDKDAIEGSSRWGADFKARLAGAKPLPEHPSVVVGMLFFEDSTRTRVSFEQAARYLGMRTANFAASSSSMNKGETLKDTVLTLRHERLDGLVMRHRMSGAPVLAARHFGGPVVNAGDGWHEHPTQALGDALTIRERKGRLDGLVVAIIGDVAHSRVARSNAWLLSTMGAEVRFVGPRTLIPAHPGALPGKVYYDLETGLSGADVALCLRLQRERMSEALLGSVSEYASLYQVNRESLRVAKRDCLVMHPGPINRGVEVDDAAADGDRSAISAQIENGIFVRMAALHWCFSEGEAPKPPAKKRVRKVKA